MVIVEEYVNLFRVCLSDSVGYVFQLLVCVVVGIPCYSGEDTGDVRIYNPATDSWSLGTSSPIFDAEFYQAGVVAGKIYVIGGRGTFTGNEEYDPSTDTWTFKTPMPTGRPNDLTLKIYP
jgi:hypothetical protein